jgi:hypothetical protein
MNNKNIIFLAMFLFPTITFSQETDSVAKFIPYKLSSQVDSMLTLKLDSISKEIIDSNIVIDIYFSYDETINDYYIRSRYEKNWSYRLIYLNNYRKDKKDYFSYLARNSSRYYVSSNNKYKIPIVFANRDERFKYDDKTYPDKLRRPKHIFLVVLEYDDKIKIDLNEPIPNRLLRKE